MSDQAAAAVATVAQVVDLVAAGTGLIKQAVALEVIATAPPYTTHVGFLAGVFLLAFGAQLLQNRLMFDPIGQACGCDGLIASAGPGDLAFSK
jgi:hypothetical protein